jgi:oxygen-independent coproporphyrinogen-3 oxidase
MLPLSLYVHLPWCVRKCPYCDFNSYKAGTHPARDRYVDALLIDLEAEARRAGGRELGTVFLGGGTPSLFPPEHIARILGAVRDQFNLAADAEISMEANPGTVECGSPTGYREAGVNRLSIGAQSFSDTALSVLGRVHAADDIARAVDEARAAGFENLNLDLMYALPGQDVDGAIADIESAAALEPAHISWYQLTLEPNTVFHARPPDGMPNDELAIDIQESGQARLRELGYEQYEVSAWARDGRRCRHNLNYWLFGDYLAAGAGAHGKITIGRGAWRYAKPANPLSYMRSVEDGRTDDGSRQLGNDELLFEFMLNALRLPGGFETSLFEQRTGLSAAVLENSIAAQLERGLMEPAGASGWRPTELGFRFLNELQASFLPES